MKKPKVPTAFTPSQLALVAQIAGDTAVLERPEATIIDPENPEPPPGLTPPAVDLSVDAQLVRILSWKRNFGSPSELEFMSWLGGALKTMSVAFEIGPLGNLIAEVPRNDGRRSTVLFSCHTDTMHTSTGAKQSITFDPLMKHIFLNTEDPNAGECLGADDGAGVWLMLRMIEAKVPGAYVFHRGEERGAHGSREMVKTKSKWLENFDCAIAFDRPNISEVITHQGGLRCASDKFGEALAVALSKHDGLVYAISDRGVFTDTKLYRGLIAECLNIGVGYYNQHSRSEYLDYRHLLNLRDACISIDWEALPVDRDPKAVDPVRPMAWKPTGPWKQSDAFSSWDGRPDEPIWNKKDWSGDKKHLSSAKSTKYVPSKNSLDLTAAEELDDMSIGDIVAFCEDQPDVMAKLVVELCADLAAAETKIKHLRMRYCK